MAPAPASPPALPKPLQLPLSVANLEAINSYLTPLTPQDVLSWAIEHLPSLYQTTAFGLTGCATTDMLAKLTKTPPPLIFIDTLHHFRETLDLMEEMKNTYGVPVHVYKPEGCETAEDFERKYGTELWKRDESLYDYTVKVEPAQRAYKELGVQAVITGRRASQGASRAGLQPLEVDGTGLLKLNPLCTWNFHLVQWYVDQEKVPTNALLTQGYRSVGDWHSTAKAGDGDAGERAGRWAGRDEKTECGLHVDPLKMHAAAKQLAEEQAQNGVAPSS